jgi:hypothetical protein
MTFFAPLLAAIVLALGPSLPARSTTAHAQGRKTFVGTWTYNAQKSTPTANTYKYRRIVVTEAASGLAFSIEEALAGGPALLWGFTTRGDGTPAPVTGIGAIDTAVANIEARSGIVEYRKGMTVVTRSLIETSEDGAVLTISSSRTKPHGTAVKARTQYDRQ